MKVITIANQKGGVGKSTIAINIAHALKDGAPTYLLDFDLQGSASFVKPNGYTKLNNDDFMALDFNTEGVLIIDTPPYLTDNYEKIIKHSNLVIIPTKPAYFDLAATNRTIETIYSYIGKNDKVGVVLFQNMVKKSSTITDELKDVVATFNIPILKTYLTERVSYIRSVMLPDGIYSTQDRKAQSEFNNFVKECLIYLTK